MTTRAAWRRRHPQLAVLLARRQRAVFDDWRAAWDPLPGPVPPQAPGHEPPPFTEASVWAWARPLKRSDHALRALASALEQVLPALSGEGAVCGALLPVARGAAWAADDGRRVHPPLARARQAAAAGGVQPRPEEAVLLSARTLPQWLPLWFWSERCGAVPGGLLALWERPAGSPGCLLISLCAYGNLHVECHGLAAAERTRALLQGAGLRPLTESCPLAAVGAAATPGRRLAV